MIEKIGRDNLKDILFSSIAGPKAEKIAKKWYEIIYYREVEKFGKHKVV